MSKSGLSKILDWDGKTESFGVYVSKIEAYAKFLDMGDVLDTDLMQNFPTKLEFVVLDVTSPNNQQLAELYWANKELCAIIMLGQGKVREWLSSERQKMTIIPMD